MKSNQILLSFICIFSFAALHSCTRTTTLLRTTSATCDTSIFGYTATGIVDTNIQTVVIDTALTLSYTGTSLINDLYSNKTAFNSADTSFYFFTWTRPRGLTRKLTKINSAGVVTNFSNASGDTLFINVVYNPISNKLYCISDGYLCYITISGSSFTTNRITPLINPLFSDWASLVVDPATGTMYYWTKSSSSVFIEKYQLGTSAATIAVSLGSRYWALGRLCFNPINNTIYCMTSNSPGADELIVIDPSTRSVSTLHTFPSQWLNPEFNSACIDPCSGNYYLSNYDNNTHTSTIHKFNASGTLLRLDTTATFVQGLESKSH